MSLPTPAATPSPPTTTTDQLQAARPSSTLAMLSTQPTDASEASVTSVPLQRRHSIHTTSPTTSDQLPLPEVASPTSAELEGDRPASSSSAIAASGLASFDTLYQSINAVPLGPGGYDQQQQQPYYPLGGPQAGYHPGSPPFASQWATSQQQHHPMSYSHAPPHLPTNGEKRKGHCKFFNALKGFGFIIDDNGAELGNDVEVFVHYSAIEAVQSGRGGFRSLLEGEEVEYTIMQGPKGWQAQSVTGPHGNPCIGSPSNAPHKSLGPPPDGFRSYGQRKFSVGSMGGSEDGYRLYNTGGAMGVYNSQRSRGSISGMDSGYYSSAMTSPVHTPHQLYPPPQYPAYHHPSPHAAYGPPPIGIPLALHHSQGAYSFLPPPPPPHEHADGPPIIPGQDEQTSPYRPMPSSAFFPPVPGGAGAPNGMGMGYYPGPPHGVDGGGGFYPPPPPGVGGDGAYLQGAYAYPPPLPLPMGMVGGQGWAAEVPQETQEEGEGEAHEEGEVEVLGVSASGVVEGVKGA